MKQEFKNTTIFKRANHDVEHPYSLVSMKLIGDKRLNFFEKGLMTWILSHRDDYVLNMNYAETISGFGKTIHANASKKLQELGYLKKERVKGGWHWTVNEIPEFGEIQQGSNANIKKSTLNNDGSDVNVEKLMLENELIISTNKTSIEETNTEEETNIDEINHFPNSTNLNNGNGQPKEEGFDNKLDVDASDLDTSLSIQPDTEKSNSGYDPIQIQNEIGAFNPVYFKNSISFIGNVYNEFVKITDINIPIQEFEKVMLLEIHNQYSIANPNDDEYRIEKLKLYLKTHTQTISPSNIQDTLNSMRNPKNTEAVVNIIEKYSLKE